MPTILGTVDGAKDATVELEKSGNLWITRKSFDDTYIVMSDNTAQDEDDILATPGLPTKFYPLGGCFCISVKAKEVETVHNPVTGTMCTLWHVAASFKNNVDPEQDQSPESKRPIIAWSGDMEKEVVTKDVVDGRPIQTKNGEPLFCEDDRVFPILHITRYETFPFDPLRMILFANHTNRDTFYGAPPGTALMLPMEVEEDTIESVRYNKVQYHIKFNMKPLKDTDQEFEEDSWDFEPLHQGFLFRPGNFVLEESVVAKPKIYKDENGHPQLVNLDAFGQKLADDAEPVYLRFKRKRKADFDALSLGPF